MIKLGTEENVSLAAVTKHKCDAGRVEWVAEDGVNDLSVDLRVGP